jgi:hypothetical protein
MNLIIKGNNTIGWNICWQPTGVTYTFGLANYKCSIFIDGTLSDYFFMDYRTSDLAEAYTATDDIDVYLNVNDGKLYWDNSLIQLVGTGSQQTIWDLGGDISLKTTELEPYITASFDVSGTSYPQLSWTHYPKGYRTGYAIYRSVVSGCGSPSGTFTKIAQPLKYATSYTDYDFAVGGPITAYYKIRTVNGTRESEDSYTKNICVGLYKGKGTIEKFDFSLNQNYPNPFNPTTAITYSLAENSFVTISVYDLLGNKISQLVNEYQIAGKFEISFDGNDLSTGVYLYVMRAGKFTDVKKLILIK